MKSMAPLRNLLLLHCVMLSASCATTQTSTVLNSDTEQPTAVESAKSDALAQLESQRVAQSQSQAASLKDDAAIVGEESGEDDAKSETPDESEVSFAQDTEPRFRQAAIEFYRTSRELRNLSSAATRGMEYSPENKLKAREAIAKEHWPLLGRFIDSKKPFVIAHILYYGYEDEVDESNANTVYSIDVDANKSTLLKMATFGPDRTHCEDWACTSKGFHMEAQTDYFAWDEDAQKVLWVGIIRHFSGFGARRDEELRDAMATDKMLRDEFKMKVNKLHGVGAIK